MADGAKFDIRIEAEGIGVDATTDQLNALASKMQSVDTVATSFDAAVAAATARLAEASTAAQEAASALGVAQSRYSALERDADRAAKAVERATLAGKDTTKLRAQADMATEAMRKQAAIVDALKVKSNEAAAAQSKLAGSLKTLQAGQSKAAKGDGGALDASKLAKANAMAMAVKDAYIAIAKAVVGAVASVGKFALAANPMVMMRLQQTSMRLDMTLKRLFLGLKFDKFLGALDRMAALFDTTSASGKALKLLVEVIFQPLLDALAKIEPYVSEVFKGLVYGALLAVLAVLKIRNAIWRAMSPETRAAIKAVIDKVATMENAFRLGTVVGVALAAVLGVVALAFVGVGISIALCMVPFLLFWAAVTGIVKALSNWDSVSKWLTDTWNGFTDWAAGLAKAAKNWGLDIVSGLTGGLLGGSKDLGDAMGKLAAATKDGYKGPLKIQSPSRVMMQLGAYAAEGLSIGMDASIGDVRDSAAAMAGATAGGASAGTTTSTSSRSIHIGSLVVHASGGDGESITAAVKRALLEVLEGASLSVGGGEVPA